MSAYTGCGIVDCILALLRTAYADFCNHLDWLQRLAAEKGFLVHRYAIDKESPLWPTTVLLSLLQRQRTLLGLLQHFEYVDVVFLYI